MVMDFLFSQIPEGWEETTLGEACIRSGGNIQTGPFGSQLHASDYVSVGIPSIMPQNIGDNHIITDRIARITTHDAERLDRYRVKVGDIIYSRRGDVERRAIIREGEEGWLCGTGCLRVRFDNSTIDPLFISYYLGHPKVRQWIVRHAVGATMPNLNTSILSALPLMLPPLPEQHAIANILSALDDKIEMNRQMNKTLEAIAKAIFKSWFVDFDPVRTKMEGQKVYGMDDETAALFPDSFEDSELGKVPNGWKPIPLNAVATFIKGVSYKSDDLRESEVALVTLKSISRGGGYNDEGLKPYTGEFKSEQRLLPGEVVVAHTDLTQAAEVLGRVARVRYNQNFHTLVASLDLVIVRSSATYVSNEFLYGLLSQEAFQEHAYSYANGSTVLHLSARALPEYQFVLPASTLIKKFTTLICPFYQMMDQNEELSFILTSMRDTLLPKLISGEIRVKDAEKYAEALL